MERGEIERLASQVVDSALRVHLALGPGLLESAYEACLAHELRMRGIGVRQQCGLPVVYRGVRVDVGYRLDLLVEDAIVVELKTAATLLPIHEAQLLSYLKLSGRKLGFLLNFHSERLRDGMKRMVNDL